MQRKKYARSGAAFFPQIVLHVGWVNKKNGETYIGSDDWDFMGVILKIC